MKYEKTVFKTILRYAIPSVVSMWIFTLYTMVDGIFIGKYVGALGLAGVNITMPLINLTFAFNNNPVIITHKLWKTILAKTPLCGILGTAATS